MPQLTGTGTMGAAIAALAAKGGRSVQTLGSVDTAVAVTALAWTGGFAVA